jgi:colanic acid biosynthesis glycosyl transferase WcaI
MRLLVVSQYYWPENFRINDLVAELVARGHAVTVLTGVPNYPQGTVLPQYRARPADFVQHAGAQVVRVPMLARGRGAVRLVLNYLSFALSASVFGPWKLRGRAFDAILAYEPSPITVGLPAAALRAIKRAPLAFWVLDLWPETLHAIGVVRSPRVLALVGRLVRFIYRRCDLILAQSRSFIPQIRRYADAGTPVEYFPNWAEALFTGGDAVRAPEVPLSSGSFDVMFAGNVGDAQDFPAILDAAERLRSHRHIRWLIVGDGRLSGWVSAEVARRGLQEQVLLLGRFPVDRMPSFFLHAGALLVSLRKEPIFAMTIPGKLQSYLAAGIPVLAMLDGEGADLVRSSACGLACPAGDSGALADAVLALAAMPAQERQAMGDNGRRASAREFDRAMLIDQIEGRLQALAGRSAP